MKRMRSIATLLLTGWMILASGCRPEVQPYGVEEQLVIPGKYAQVWAIAPAVNLSGERGVDPLLQADLVYHQAQTIKGVTVLPVQRVVEVYMSLNIEKVQSPEQAALVCDLLGCDGLVVPSITIFDPYNPPKFGAALQLFSKPTAYSRDQNIDPRELARMAAPPPDQATPPSSQGFVQVVAMFDATNGSVRDELMDFAKGRNDPTGPMKEKEYLVSMDRYCEFAWNSLLSRLLRAQERAQRH